MLALQINYDSQDACLQKKHPITEFKFQWMETKDYAAEKTLQFTFYKFESILDKFSNYGDGDCSILTFSPCHNDGQNVISQ